MLTDTKDIGGITVLSAVSKRLTSSDLPQFKLAKQQMHCRGNAAMIIDLGHVQKISQAGLGALVEFAREFEGGTALVLANANTKVAGKIGKCSMTALLPHFETVEGALKSQGLRRFRLNGIHTIILNAGRDRPLKPLSRGTTLPLLDLLGVPILQHQLRQLRDAGLNDVTVTASHQTDQLTNFIVEDHRQAVRFSFERRSTPRGWVAAPLGEVASLVQIQTQQGLIQKDCLILDGALIADVNWGHLLNLHHNRNAALTVALATPQSRASAGALLVKRRDDGRLLRAPSTHAAQDPTATFQVIGAYAVSPQMIDRFALVGHAATFKSVILDLLDHGEAVFGCVHKAPWRRVDTAHDYAKTAIDGLTHAFDHINMGAKAIRPGVWVAPTAQVAKAAEISGPCYIGSNCKVARNSRLIGPVVLAAGCEIAEKTLISNSVLLEGTVVQPGAWVCDQLLQNNWSIPYQSTRNPTQTLQPLDQIGLTPSPVPTLDQRLSGGS